MIRVAGTLVPPLMGIEVGTGAFRLFSGDSSRDSLFGYPVYDLAWGFLSIPSGVAPGSYQILTSAWNATLEDFHIVGQTLDLTVLP